ncbi:MAG: polysaccharide pyruvyl transferase family protein [Syntrophotaleaceae bacterium]
MSSVDLAFFAFARRHFPEAELHFLKISDEGRLHAKRMEEEKTAILQRTRLPFQYACFLDDLDFLYESDLIVYWGDFFHMAHYRLFEARRQVKLGTVASLEQGLEFVDKHFFLEDASPEIFRKVIVFGENLLFNKIEDYAGGTYAQSLKRFLGRVDNVWMRDVFSALRVNHLKGNFDNSFLGMDCAFLLRDEDLEILPRNFPRGNNLGTNKVGVFFHRNSGNRSKQFVFARRLARAAGLEAQWLPWRIVRNVAAKKRWHFPSLQLINLEKEACEGGLFDLLKGYAFVVTDTYHVCVNAWRLGTPAICIGETINEEQWDVSCGPAHAWRDKRWVFYSMVEALNYYVHAHELTSRRLLRKRLGQLREALSRDQDIRLIVHFIERQRDSLEGKLAQVITGIFQNQRFQAKQPALFEEPPSFPIP